MSRKAGTLVNHDKLSARLTAVAEFVEQGAILADIGSDHAYLPCYLVSNGKVKKAIAGEVVKGPYESAKRNVAKKGLSEKIEVRLANGLAAIKSTDEVDTVTIAGMGGPLIASILDAGTTELGSVKRIIAQPNIHASSIREWAVKNGWIIVNELILEEDNKIYEIIVLERGTDTYDELQMLVGPILMIDKSTVFIDKWNRESSEWQRIADSLEQAGNSEDITNKKQELKKKIELIRRVLST